MYEEWQEAIREWSRLGYDVVAQVKGERFTLVYGKPMLFIPPFSLQTPNPALKERLDRFIESGKVRWLAVPYGTEGKGNSLFKVIELDSLQDRG